MGSNLEVNTENFSNLYFLAVLSWPHYSDQVTLPSKVRKFYTCFPCAPSAHLEHLYNNANCFNKFEKSNYT